MKNGLSHMKPMLPQLIVMQLNLFRLNSPLVSKNHCLSNKVKGWVANW
jgi:hypothetical protein